MKHIKLFISALFFAPSALFAANDFQIAAQLLSAAKNADIQQVQTLVNNGADVNFTDSTGLSIVCTALMNNDVRAAQILQMYGADASKCDQQIKRYNQKKPKTESGGLFSGLSSAQGIALTAAGAAVVVGGLLLLTDVFDSSNGNSGGGGTGQCRPNSTCTCSNGSTGTCKTDGTCDCTGNPNPGPTPSIALPYGPAYFNVEGKLVYSDALYRQNQDFYSPTTTGTMKDTFTLMTDTYGQNYLLMMHGYSPMAHGYTGMRTIRNSAREPIFLAGNHLGTEAVLGGRPVNVALVTANGINAPAKPAGELSEQGSSLDDTLLPWTTTNSNGTSTNGASNDMISSKYYNNTVNRGTDNESLLDDWTEEDLANLGLFDLSSSGTAINNGLSSDADDLLAKIVGGKTSSQALADFMGFMPNGQMTIFRTGGGFGMKAADGSVSGGYTDEGDGKIGTGDTVNLFGQTLTLTMDTTGKGFTLSDGGTNSYRGYIGADGLLYLASTLSGGVDKAYQIETNGDLTYAKELTIIDYANYKALLNAGAMWLAGDLDKGRSRPDIIANASVIAPLRGRDVETVSDILSYPEATRQAAFIALINKYYDQDTTDGVGGANALPGTDAFSFFNQLGSGFSPLVIFSTGAFETDSAYSGRTLEAGFENSAPLIFSNLEHLFMSVVAVGLTGSGTSGTGSVTGYSPGGKIALSQWQDQNDTPGDASDDKYYKARACGIGGSGANGIDPWCFAAAGVTDELAVASMAGAAGAIKSAFDYLNNKQLFALLALTADGPFLATNANGTAMTSAELKSHLQAMYELPAEYQYRVDQGGEDYFKVFKEVFGYGLINLDRATKPTSKIYYYNGDNIVSG
ncbi:MAG: ankyrin repeat domain-containing protein, partial [Rickettsiales bacterium]|nr:ankyrin repeat domain-containing protein [Rickettsiales bacterium]